MEHLTTDHFSIHVHSPFRTWVTMALHKYPSFVALSRVGRLTCPRLPSTEETLLFYVSKWYKYESLIAMDVYFSVELDAL